MSLNFIITRGRENTNYGNEAGLVVTLLLEGEDAESYFKQLECHRKDIEWEPSVTKNKKLIYAIKIVTEDEWSECIDWHIETMTKFIEVFPSYVKKLKKDEEVDCIENLVSGIIYADEVGEDLFEGAQKQVIVNTYERNPEAREKCLKEKGYNCSVCNLNFEDITALTRINQIKWSQIEMNFNHSIRYPEVLR